MLWAGGQNGSLPQGGGRVTVRVTTVRQQQEYVGGNYGYCSARCPVVLFFLPPLYT